MPDTTLNQKDFETLFLQQYIADFQAEITKKLEHWEAGTDPGDTPPLPGHTAARGRGRDYELAMYEQAANTLLDLLQAKKQSSQPLAHLLECRLHRAEERLKRLAQSQTYNNAYWQASWEYQFFIEMLDSWWDWLQNEPHHA